MDQFLDAKLKEKRLEYVDSVIKLVEKDSLSSADIYFSQLEPTLKDESKEYVDSVLRIIGILIKNSYSVLKTILKFSNPSHSLMILNSFFSSTDANESHATLVIPNLIAFMDATKDKTLLNQCIKLIGKFASSHEKVLNTSFGSLSETLLRLFLRLDDSKLVEPALKSLKSYFINNIDITNTLLDKCLNETKTEYSNFTYFVTLCLSLDSYIEVPTRKFFDKAMNSLRMIPFKKLWKDLTRWVPQLTRLMSDFGKYHNSLIDMFIFHFQVEIFELPTDFYTFLSSLKIEKWETIKKLLPSLSQYILEESNPNLLQISKFHHHLIQKFEAPAFLYLTSEIPEFREIKKIQSLDSKREMLILFHLNMVLYSLEENPSLMILVWKNFQNFVSLAFCSPKYFSMFLDKLLEFYISQKQDCVGLVIPHLLTLLDLKTECYIEVLRWIRHISKTCKLNESILSHMSILYETDHIETRILVLECVEILLVHFNSLTPVKILCNALEDVDGRVQTKANEILDKNYTKLLSAWTTLQTSENVTLPTSSNFANVKLCSQILAGEMDLKQGLDQLYTSCHLSQSLHTNSDRFLWFCNEVTNYLIMNRLKWVGDAADTFARLEKSIQSGIHASVLSIQIVLNLEKGIQQLLEQQSNSSPQFTFFVSNRRVCDEWFARLKKEMIQCKWTPPTTQIRLMCDRIMDTTSLDTNVVKLTNALMELGEMEHIVGLQKWIRHVKIEPTLQERLLNLTLETQKPKTQAQKFSLSFMNVFQLETMLVERYGIQVPYKLIQHDTIKNQLLEKQTNFDDEMKLIRIKMEKHAGNYKQADLLIESISNPTLKILNKSKLIMKEKDEESGIQYLAQHLNQVPDRATPLLFIDKWVEKDPTHRKDFVDSILDRKTSLSDSSPLQYAKWLISHQIFTNETVESLIRALSKNEEIMFVTLSLLKIFPNLDKKFVVEQIEKTSSNQWIGIIPQLFAHPNEEIIAQIICKIAQDFPNLIVYPLLASKKTKLIAQIKSEHPQLFSSTEMFFTEILRITSLWDEECIRILRKKKERNTFKNWITSLLSKSPETKHEVDFFEKYEKYLLEFQISNDSKKLERLLTTQSTFQLNDISLLNSKDILGRVLVPGRQKEGITIQTFSNQVQVVISKTRPKKMSLTGSDGKIYTFLIKGFEDLRLDARIMQILDFLNTKLNRARNYCVTPLQKTGLIEVIPNVVPILSIYKDWFSKRFPKSKPIDLYYKKLILKESLKQVYKELTNETPNDLLSKFIWRQSLTTSDWWNKTKRYTNSLSIMSIIGWIIGLGDRHLDNILYDSNTSEIVHIDYNICFEKGKQLRVPEVVPFRLTPILTHPFGITGEALFKSTAIQTFKTCKREGQVLKMLLETFVYDPIVEWMETPNTIITRIKELEEVKNNVVLALKKFKPISIGTYQKNLMFTSTPLESTSVYEKKLKELESRLVEMESQHKKIYQMCKESQDPNILEYYQITTRFEKCQDVSTLCIQWMKRLKDRNEFETIVKEMNDEPTLQDVLNLFSSVKTMETTLKQVQNDLTLFSNKTYSIKGVSVVPFLLNQIMKVCNEKMESNGPFESNVVVLIHVLAIFRLISQNGKMSEIVSYLEGFLDSLMQYYIHGDWNQFCKSIGISNYGNLSDLISNDILTKIKKIPVESFVEITQHPIVSCQQNEMARWKTHLEMLQLKNRISESLKKLFDISWNCTPLFEEYEKVYGPSQIQMLSLKKQILSKIGDSKILQMEQERMDRQIVSNLKTLMTQYVQSLEKDKIAIREAENAEILKEMNTFKNSDEFIQYFELISEYESLSKGKLKEFSKIVSTHKKHMIEYINFENETFFDEIPAFVKEIEKLYDLDLLEEDSEKTMDESIVKKVMHKLNYDISKVDSLISHAKSLDRLSSMYEGWMPWV